MISGTDWLVILGGLAAIAWVNWYFFVAARGTNGAPVAPPAEMEGDVTGREHTTVTRE